MTEVPLTLTVPCVGWVLMVRLAAAPPDSESEIGSLVEPSATVWLELAAAGAGGTSAALTVMDAVLVDEPAALMAV